LLLLLSRTLPTLARAIVSASPAMTTVPLVGLPLTVTSTDRLIETVELPAPSMVRAPR